MLRKIILSFMAALAVFALSLATTPGTVQAAGESDFGSSGSGSLRCSSTLAEFESGAIASVTQGTATLFAGYAQVSGNNQNPIIARWTEGQLDWCNDAIEQTGDDGRAYGLWWDGGNQALVVFSATGTQSGPNYTRWTGNGWLNSYGAGGNKKVAIILSIDATANGGDPILGTYLTARLTNGESNSVAVQGLDVAGNGNVVVQAQSWFSPRNTDKSRMNCSGDSPFSHYIEFNSTMSTAVGSTAERCTPKISSDPPPNAPVPQYITRSSPANEASNVSNTASLSWQEDDHAQWYRVFLQDKNNNAVHSAWYQDTQICNTGTCTTPAISLPNGKITWWMTASGTDSESGITYPGHWNSSVFYVGPPPPGEVKTGGPAGTIDANSITFNWEDTANATWYQVFVQGPNSGQSRQKWFADSDETLEGVDYDGVCNNGDCIVTAPETGWWFTNGTYTWYVRAWGPGGLGPWSDSDTFTLNRAKPDNLVINAPAGATAGPVTISWERNANSAWYRLWVGASDLSRKDHYQWHEAETVCNVSTCSVDVTMPAGEGIIYLRAWGPAGMSSWFGSDPFTVGN